MAAGKQAPLELVIKALDEASGPLKRVQEQLKAVAGPVPGLQAAFGAAAGEGRSGFARFAERARGAAGEVVSLTQRVVSFGASAASSLYDAVRGAASFGAALGRTAAKVGLNVDQLARLRFAGQASGLGVEEVDQALTTLTRGLGQATLEKGRLYKLALDAGGTVFANQIKNAKSMTEAFDIIVRASEKLKDPQRRLALVQAAFGNTNFSTLIAKGGSEINNLGNEFSRLAGPQQEFVNKSQGVGFALLKAKTVFEAIKRTLLIQFAPAIIKIADLFTEFFTANRPAIAAWAKDFGDKLPGRLNAFLARVRDLGTKGSEFLARIGGWTQPLLALGAVIGVKLVLAVYALGAALLANPIVLIITAIALAAVLIRKYWEPIKGFFVDLWERIREPVTAFWEWLKGAFLSFAPVAYVVANWEPIKAYFIELWGDVKQVFSVVWDAIKDVFFNAAPLGLVIANWTPIKEFFIGLWTLIREPFWAAIAWIKEWGLYFVPGGFVIKQWEFLKTFFITLWDEIQSRFQAAWAFIEPIVKKLEAAGGVLGKIPSLNVGGLLVDQAEAAVGKIRALGREELSTVGAGAGGPGIPLEGLRPSTLPVQKAKVEVTFANVPKGVRVTEATGNEAELGVDVGYSNEAAL